MNQVEMVIKRIRRNFLLRVVGDSKTNNDKAGASAAGNFAGPRLGTTYKVRGERRPAYVRRRPFGNKSVKIQQLLLFQAPNKTSGTAAAAVAKRRARQLNKACCFSSKLTG